MTPPTTHASPSATAGGDAPRELYEELTDDLLYDPAIGRGTIMGHPCIRLAGQFVACLDQTGTSLVLKLPAPRVTALIDSGTGVPFSPATRTLREWVAIPTADRHTWQSLLAEAVTHARTTVTGKTP